MKARHKPVGEQVLVITGGSSGIGRVTAREAAKRGAKVVITSRDEEDLREAAEEIRASGGTVEFVVADVADRDALHKVADHAERTFGRIDTWVNNAGVSIYGPIRQVTMDDARRLFETNYWGVVHGSLVAVERMRENGGSIVNIGSVLSDTGYPLQGHYSASKHAVKGFTDSLRMELEKDKVPITVSLVKPAAIDTPYPEHAQNYMEVEVKHQPPVYAPEVVAKAILTCAEKGNRDIKAGGSTKMFTTLETFAPRFADRFKGSTVWKQTLTDRPARHDGTLHAPRPGDARERGNYPGKVFERSAFTALSSRPVALALGVAVLGVALGLASRRRGRNGNGGDGGNGGDDRGNGTGPKGGVRHETHTDPAYAGSHW